jgi:hypothetical protein
MEQHTHACCVKIFPHKIFNWFVDGNISGQYTNPLFFQFGVVTPGGIFLISI